MEHIFAAITWRPRIGDPNLIAWCITGTYFVAAWMCYLAGRKCRTESGTWTVSKIERFWNVLAMLMFALGCNKQLDIHTLLTQIGREVARVEGWYPYRKRIQAVFIVICALVGVTCGVAGLWFTRRRWRQCGVACVGIIFLITFVVIRAASFHHVDRLLYHLPQLGRWVNNGLEFSGTLLVALGALQSLRLPLEAAGDPIQAPDGEGNRTKQAGDRTQV